MKKKLILTLVLFMLLLFSALTAEAANAPSVFINGTQLISHHPVVIENGSTLVPLRTIFEALDQPVNWHAGDRTITSGNIWLQINNTTALVGDKRITLNKPAKLINGGTYVPLRFIAESLGKDVHWDSHRYRIDITDPAAPNSSTINPELDFVLTDVYYDDNDELKAMGTFTNIGNVFITKVIYMDVILVLANDAGDTGEISARFNDMRVDLGPGASTEYEFTFTDAPVYTDATEWWLEEYHGEFEHVE